MKICPICDKKVAGNWCGSCFKFVTPWELSNGIHINERHSQTVDPNCDYHSPKTRFSQQEYMQPGYEEKIYGNASAASRAVVQQRQANAANRNRTVTTTKSTSSSNNGKNKMSLGAQIAIGYMIFILLATVLPVIFSFMDDVEFGSREPETMPIEYLDDYNYTETDSWYSDSDSNMDYDYDIDGDYSYLDMITPVETETEEYGDYIYTYSYYDSEDLKLVGHNCDEEHIDLYYQDLTTMIDMVYPGYSFSYSVDDDYYYNCLEQTDGYSYASFETYVEIVGEDFGIDVSYDSSTEQIHYYLFYADDFNETFMQEAYKWFGFATPGLFASYDEFAECIGEVQKSDDVVYLEYEEQCVYFAAYDEYVIIDFESIYY